MSGPAIQLREVFCVHRTSQGDAAALQGMNLVVERGERLCVLGPSGAGKTTLLRVIAGLHEPSAGTALVFGRDVGRLSAGERAKLRHRAVGFLSQRAEAALPPDLRIDQAVALPLALRGSGRAVSRTRAAELLDAVGLGDRARALPGQLSGGERQRVALCAALAHRPALLLADEPTGELDESSARSIAELIERLGGQDGTTVIVVSHDAAMAERSARSLQIRDGRVVADGRTGNDSLVIGAGGWVRLPEELLERAHILGRAHASALDRGLLLTPAGGGAPGRGDAPGRSGAPIPDRPFTDTRTTALTRGAVGGGAALVELKSVNLHRGRDAARRMVIDNLTLRFEPGRLTAITGRTGAGKTTLLELLGCLGAPDSGELRLDGVAIPHSDPERLAAIRRERIGYLPQDPAPVGFLSAVESVALALRVRGIEDGLARGRAERELRRVGLGDRLAQRVARLSAGETQRVGLARALATANGLLIVDEPTSRLDRATASLVAGLLAETAGGRRQTVICATHDGEVIRRAARVVELERR